jgi:hypothetical protein
MSWGPGSERIQQLIDTGELAQVPADSALARRMLADAARHLATAATAESTQDLSGAYQLAYDALRKSAASLLEAQGLRSTSRGGHLAVQDAAIAQFGPTIRALRSFSRIRRARNSFEYPSCETPGPSTEDVRDAIKVATEVHHAAGKILDSSILPPWSGSEL